MVAALRGEEVRANDASEMQAAIVTSLLDRYAADHGIEVREAELDAYRSYFEERQQAGAVR